MVKVKIFSDHNKQTLENDINTFLQERKKYVSVQDIKYNTVETGDNIHYSAMIICDVEDIGKPLSEYPLIPKEAYSPYPMPEPLDDLPF